MARPIVVAVYSLPPHLVERLEAAGAEVIVIEEPTDSVVAEAMRGAYAVVTRGPAKITEDQINGATHLRLIAGTGSGTDAIDVPAASSRGVLVTSGVGVGHVSVAEWAIGAAIAVHRGLLPNHKALASGTLDWTDRLAVLGPTELHGKTVGIIGLGHIGREVARITRLAFSMIVLGYDPFASESPDDIETCESLDDLLERSSTVMVHVPLSNGTRGMIGRGQLRLIGSEGVLINAARGGVVVESDLVDALIAGELRGAAIDVFEKEPPSPEQIAVLASVPNLLLSPHIAGGTVEAFARLQDKAVKAVTDVLSGRTPEGIVNKST